jgi:hypothetical protein
VHDEQLRREIMRLLESGDLKKVTRSIARLLREEEVRREQLEKLLRFGQG